MRYLSFILALALFSACDPGVSGNGNVTKRSISVEDFDELVVNGAFEIFVRQGNEYRLEIEMDENLFEYLDIDNDEEELDISMDRRIRKSKATNIYVTVRELDEIKINGANELETRGGLRGEALYVEANGASEMRIEYEGSLLRIEGNGGSELWFRGQVDDLEIDVNGAAEIEAFDMRALRADVNVSGAAEVKIWAEDKLNIEASGASKVEYRGNPDVHQDTSGPSSIERVGR